ncbi:TetR/AcrR family transcriptional regulator [Paraburkholderia sp. 22099]|jgi:AcrR family transcriptional regulator|uniref:AcrR family transcriptional regulator n=1 Tax=Paraburkholderia terricola TaxID=169427 RepID=A0A1M6VGF5_9BURK|nr:MULTISPECIES: TetR/AcrR family transcriptional regulator [Paraburkholderia]ORC52843.1 TetR family transcriptional regulator [Burkholderia sp. A27]AXE95033.1 TetR/AcrR family transcriptional regulator [Paraburkholderia terricola]MDR6410359.1 AcrR family transcriptional regulator [Paraburkholderia terricola]MDR6481519.1 AcrR family transcriptional regulator [Paraburkholderia terricola]MDR6491695.1 AcrR family transcriptional regulator [Paraburkholderia terricola]
MYTATKPQRLSREESRLQTRADLLAAAKRLFVEKGFGGTSLRDIAAEAGYTQGAFYSNFASKEDLFVELMRERSRTQVSDIGRTLSDPSASADDILNALEVWAQTLDAEPEWSVLGVEFKLQGRRNPVFATASQALLDAHRDGLAYCIGQIFARLEKVPPESPTVLAAAFMGLSQGLALQRSMLAEAPIGHMIMVFLRSLLAAAPRVR